MTGDRPLMLLLAALVTLTFATLAMCWSLGAPGSAVTHGAGWDVWNASTTAERQALMAVFEQTQQREDGRTVLIAARRFASKSDEQQARLRQVHAALATLDESLPAAQRRSIRALPPEGRAAQLYRLMETRAPETLRKLLGMRAENK